MRIDVMGVGFDSLTMDEAVARARDLMAERRGLRRHAESGDRDALP